MLVYRYWKRVAGVIVVDGVQKKVTCLAGSNISEDDADRVGRERLRAIQRKIDGDRDAFAGYQTPIREEVIEELSEDVVVTRNRYGARVLNARTTMIIDVDKPPASALCLLPWRQKKPAKEQIVEMVRRRAQSYPVLAIRIYETCQGVRLIVLGKPFDASSPESAELMRAFHADALYALLCRKQGCFRARLTPKPYRMKFRGHRVGFPIQTEEERERYDTWVAEYEERAKEFSVCRYLETIGSAFTTETVRYHDEETNAQSSLPLA